MFTVLAPFFMIIFAAVISFPLARWAGVHSFRVLSLMFAAAAVVYSLALPRLIRGEILQVNYEWVPQFAMTLDLRIDLLGGLMALLVSAAGALILWYCASYFDRDDRGVPRFASVFTFFAAAMLGLVLSDDVYLLFVFWELTTILSFLLIGHFNSRAASRSAALQAMIVTTFGGLAMLVGVVLLVVDTGTSSLSLILQLAPSGPNITVAVYLLLAGALSKSAILPFHFWLPGAMAAPTPVSAYLHAAAMVKAGIYLLARIIPVFGDLPGMKSTLIVLGGATMLIGAFHSLRQFDLKLVLAYGTVSQLGMLTLVFGFGTTEAWAAAILLLFAHAVAKAPLFLIVGIIEHRTGTRDLRKIGAFWREAPVLSITALLATLSMIGVPPLLGFLAKENALIALFEGESRGVALLGTWIFIVGSALTCAYMLRFWLGGFVTVASKSAPSELHNLNVDMYTAPVAFTLLAAAGGFLAPVLDTVYQALLPAGVTVEHLALWHGFSFELLVTCGVLFAGVLVLLFVGIGHSSLPQASTRFTGSHMYFVLTQWLDVLAVRVTTLTQRGSLPFYLTVIYVVTIVVLTLSIGQSSVQLPELVLSTSPLHFALAILMIVAAVATLAATKRFQSVIFVGFTGFAMAALFAFSGAPDLALTQLMVEALTLIAFVLVIRRLPQRIRRTSSRRMRWGRALLGSTLALVIGAFTLFAMGGRIADPVSASMPERALVEGHGQNVVNVILVDIRGWDTFGELSVIVAAATGIASLVFLRTRSDELPKINRRDQKSNLWKLMRRVADPNDPAKRGTWLIAGRALDVSRRSILLEVVVRLIFHALMILSLYLLLAGHNLPGGGFVGGLVAGVALTTRYLAGGREELGATVPFDAGKIVGAGLLIAAITAVFPLFFGQAGLTSDYIDLDLGVFGELALVSASAFDIGVYLVVFGLVLDILRSLGAQIDVHREQELKQDRQEVRA